ncbi:hypothetical protein [Nioella nitratireducens]|uniref:hypothetical protein n=1 Tax=Nioella nitratireducens TaxID=1287720 RepID=UPI000B2FB745|nr:hypothetical protein [Nioella nitratireducens]
MNKLLATSAIALVALSGAASAQSVLERVLTQIDNSTNLASVNGTFANVAENIGSATAVNTYDALTATSTTGTNLVASATQAQYDAWVGANTASQTYNAVGTDLVYYDVSTGTVIRTAEYNNLTATQQAAYTAVGDGNTLIQNADGTFDTIVTTGLAAELAARTADLVNAAAGVTTAYTGPAEGINGSITNTIAGLTAATQQAIAGTVTATDWGTPTVNLGDMATTALGAVNTGDITLGVNAAVDNAQTSTTSAVSNIISQIGGSADTGAIVLNIASNMTGVNGGIVNTMDAVNGAVGALSTTALGAVNTGTITSGVGATVAGIVGSTAGQ